jgi:hypothetical protein
MDRAVLDRPPARPDAGLPVAIRIVLILAVGVAVLGIVALAVEVFKLGSWPG